MDVDARLMRPLEAQFVGPDASALRVCLVVPQSGPLGIAGPSALDAALLAAHERNLRGGADGRAVELVLVDGGGAPGAVAREVRGLCDADLVDVVVGFHTSDVHRAIESVVAGRKPYIFTPPHEGGTRRSGVVCIGVDPVSQLAGALEWLSVHHSVHRWALVGNDYIWPQAVHRVARRLLAHTAGRVVLEQRVPLGGVESRTDRLVDDLTRSRAQAVLLSLVGQDLALFNRALRHSGLAGRLVRLSGSLEENGLLASGGDRTGTMYAAMQSFTTLQDDRRLGLEERYSGLFGPEAPVLDTYAEGIYDGVYLAVALAQESALTPDQIAPATARLRGGLRSLPVHLGRADGLQFQVVS
ncbi:ABC transporter substrate-binding protein [Nocardioides pakistanensis]